MIEGAFEGVKQAPGSHRNETNETIRQGVTPNENSGSKGVLTNSNMRTITT